MIVVAYYYVLTKKRWIRQAKKGELGDDRKNKNKRWWADKSILFIFKLDGSDLSFFFFYRHAHKNNIAYPTMKIATKLIAIF